jgi:acyl carrier protein phosphodiesterase
MNHLAHALLSGPDPDLLLGGLLGDFWRGAPDPHWRPGVRSGVLLHRKIDVYTDGHPQFTAARARFEAPWRRFGGILIDMYFDHALARDWPYWADEPITALSRRVGALLRANADWLPDGLNRFAGYFESHGLFGAYAQRAAIEQALAGIGMRLRHANPLARSGPALWALAPQLDAAFEAFFPDLVGFALQQRRRLADRA